jgi:hypothetical protein
MQSRIRHFRRHQRHRCSQNSRVEMMLGLISHVIVIRMTQRGDAESVSADALWTTKGSAPIYSYN